MSQISHPVKFVISVAVCTTAGVPHTTFPVPQQPNLLLVDTFVTNTVFTISSCTRHKANVTEKAWRILFTLSLALDVPVRPDRRLRRWANSQLRCKEQDQTTGKIPVQLTLLQA